MSSFSWGESWGLVVKKSLDPIDPATIIAAERLGLSGAKGRALYSDRSFVLRSSRFREWDFILIKYRPDIDGLRSVAVLSVVLYHAGIGLFSGGYVGVDVFFVISGYLITSIILQEVTAKTFTVANFYERRVRRIFPALFLVCAVTLLVAWFLLMPVDFKEFGESITAASVFCSNIYFYAKTGYFDQEGSVRPLLHTWSLSVEEQYYIFFPLVIIILERFGQKAVRLGVVVLCLVSFLASIYAVRVSPESSFYMIWYRSWELLVGAIVSLGLYRPVNGGKVREVLSVVGSFAILASIFLYSDRTRFPGESAALPVIGTAFIIFAGEGGAGLVFKLLGSRVFVFFGKISYSLYLWHWPIFVFSRYLLRRDLLDSERAILIVLSIFVSFLSWKFVEVPMRRAEISRRNVFIAAFSVLFVFCGFGVAAHSLGGFSWRLPPKVAAAGMAALDLNPNRKSCDNRSPKQIDADEVCVIGADGTPPSFLLLGDSFADALAPGVVARAAELGQSGQVLTKGGCPPLSDVDLAGSVRDDGACRAFVTAALNFVARHQNIRTVLLIARWSAFVEGRRFGVNNKSEMFLTDDATVSPGYDENTRVLTRGLGRTLAALTDRRVVVGAFIPEQEKNIPRSVGVGLLLNDDSDPSVSRAKFDDRQKRTHMVLESALSGRSVSLLDFGQRLCREDRCLAIIDGKVIYVDDNHLTTSEAIKLSDIFDPVFVH